MSNQKLQYNQLSDGDKHSLSTIKVPKTYIIDAWIDNIHMSMDSLDKKKSKNQVNSLIVTVVLGKITFLTRPILLPNKNGEQVGSYISQTNNFDELEITYKDLSNSLHMNYQSCYRSINVLSEIGLIQKRTIIEENGAPSGVAIKINHDLLDKYSTLNTEDLNKFLIIQSQLNNAYQLHIENEGFFYPIDGKQEYLKSMARENTEVIDKPQEFKNRNNTQPTPKRSDAPPVNSQNPYMQPVNHHAQEVGRSIERINGTNGIEQETWEECKKRIGQKVNSHDEMLINSTTFEGINAEKKAVYLIAYLDNNEFFTKFVPLLKSKSFQAIVTSVLNDYPQFEGKRLYVKIRR